jgi:glyoxylase-like metal-dependent hydrolase (beta-lactamase superfamily II)
MKRIGDVALPYGGEITAIGALTVAPVFDGFAIEEPTHLYATSATTQDTPLQKGDRSEDWEPYAELLTPDGRFEHVVGGFLVSTGDRLVLVDAGVGPERIGPYGPFDRVLEGGELPARLHEIGVDPEDITDVVFSHLHPDHYGWAVEEDGRFFGNATFHCHSKDWDHFVAGAEGGPLGRAARLVALSDRLETWDDDGPLLPGIDVQLAPGHTPGSSIVVLSSGQERALLLGDVVHCPVELLDPEWASLGDVDPALARRTKEVVARELEGADLRASASHFPGMRFGRLLSARGRPTWVV